MKLMGGKIKNLFFIFIWTKKQLILAVLFLIFLGLAFPLQFAQAGVVSGILGALASIPLAIITLLLQIVLLVTNLFVSIAGVILWWVLSPYFMSLPYTHGGIVDVGWPIVRDFINMFFIIALVIIGLATALRIKEYQVQKTLPILIIIAILINFTPVICGLIVDASNIIMNFFLEELTGLRIMVTVFSTQGSLLVEMFSHPFDIRYASAALGKTIGLIAFGGIATFVFLLYSVLFIMRYIMIWVLVIVSPIAFFSRIFPATKRGEYAFKSILSWDEWWKQFIEWSLIGITAGFFLYLGEQLMVMAPDFIPGVYPEGVGGMLATPIIDFMNNLLPYGVVLAFLLLGFFVATSTSAMGAGAITGFFKEQGMAIGKAAMFPLQRLGVRGIAGAAGALGWAGGLTGKGAGLLEKIPVIGKPLALPVKGLAKGFEAVGVAPLRRYVARARRVDFDEMFKGMEAGEIAGQIISLQFKEDRVAATAWMKGKGLHDKPGVSEEFKKQMAKEAEDVSEKTGYQKSASDVAEGYSRFVSEKFLRKLQATKEDKEKVKGEVDKLAKDLSEDISKDAKLELKFKTKVETDLKEKGITEAKVGVEEYQKRFQEAMEQEIRDTAAREYLVGGLKAGDVKDVEKKSFEDIGVRRGMKKWSSAHMSALQNNFKKEVIDNALNGPGGLNAMFEGKSEEEGKAILEKLYEENPRIVHFFATTPAGREWAWKGRQFMPKTKKGRPDFGAFEVEMEEKMMLKKMSEEELRKGTDTGKEEIEKLRRQKEIPKEIGKREGEIKKLKEEARGLPPGKHLIDIQNQISEKEKEIGELRKKIMVPLKDIDQLIMEKEEEINEFTKEIGRRVEKRRGKKALEVIKELESKPIKTPAETKMLEKLKIRWTTEPAERSLELRTIREKGVPTPGTGAYEDYTREKAESLAQIESEKKWKGIPGKIRRTWTLRKGREVAEEIIKQRERWKTAPPTPGTGAYEEFEKEREGYEKEILAKAKEERIRIDALRSFRHSDPVVLSKIFRTPATSEVERKAIAQTLTEQRMIGLLTEKEAQKYKEFIERGRGVQEIDEKMQTRILKDLEKESLETEGEVKRLESIAIKSAEEVFRLSRTKSRLKELETEIEENRKIMKEIEEKEEIKKKAKEI